MVNRLYRSGAFGPNYLDQNRKVFDDMIAYSKAHGWRPILITFPLSQTLLNGLGPGFLNNWLYGPLSKANIGNIPYINLLNDPRLKSANLFGDADHLNKEGASVVSYLILQKLIRMGYLPKSADGYEY